MGKCAYRCSTSVTCIRLIIWTWHTDCFIFHIDEHRMPTMNFTAWFTKQNQDSICSGVGVNQPLRVALKGSHSTACQCARSSSIAFVITLIYYWWSKAPNVVSNRLVHISKECKWSTGNNNVSRNYVTGNVVGRLCELACIQDHVWVAPLQWQTCFMPEDVTFWSQIKRMQASGYMNHSAVISACDTDG